MNLAFRHVFPSLSVHIVYILLVYIVYYSCMLTQLYHDLLRVKLVNLNGNLSCTLDTWQIFGTHEHTRGPRRPSPCGPSD